MKWVQRCFIFTVFLFKFFLHFHCIVLGVWCRENVCYFDVVYRCDVERERLWNVCYHAFKVHTII